MTDSDLPLVSALIPVFNYGRYLARTLDSALEQDYPADRLEIVIVDDGSTDETAEVIADYRACYPRQIRAVRQDNQGFVAATNETFRHARGELWAFLDSDDIWPRAKTREQVEILMNRPQVGAVYSDTELIDPHDAPLESSMWARYSQTPITGDRDTVFRFCGEPSGNPALNSTIMLRASLASQFAPIPAVVPYVDWWLMGRLAQVSQLATNRARVGYRSHGANLTVGATGQRAVREVLKSVQMRRQLLLAGAAQQLTTKQILTVWSVMEQAAAHTASLSQSVFLPLIPATPEEIERGRLLVAEAERATLAGDFETALRHRVMAVMANPWDAESRDWVLDLRPFALEQIEIPDELGDARSSIVLSYLDELETEPQLLAAYATMLGPDDDVTLVVEATRVGQTEALARVQRLIAVAGVALEQMPDALLVTADLERTKPAERALAVELERRADALLSRRRPRLGVAAFATENLDGLPAALSAGREPAIA